MTMGAVPFCAQAQAKPNPARSSARKGTALPSVQLQNITVYFDQLRAPSRGARINRLIIAPRGADLKCIEQVKRASQD